MDRGLSRAWRKASKSNGSGGACVEIALFEDGAVGVRDSKNPHGTKLLLDPTVWATFLTRTKAGRFDL